jgi:hypothetical protein
VWDLRAAAPVAAAGAGEGRRGGGGEGGGRRGGGAQGAQVLPGKYVVKMTAGSATSEQSVTVELDPELKVSPADLKSQWDTLDRISTLIRSTSSMLRESGQHADSPAWTKFRETLAASRLTEQLQALFSLIDGPNDAPTQAMTKLLGELEGDYGKSSADFKRLNQ